MRYITETKNLFDSNNIDSTYLGVSYKTVGNGRIKLNGNRKDGINIYSVTTPNITLSAGTYTLSCRFISGNIENPSDDFNRYIYFGINKSDYTLKAPGVGHIGEYQTKSFTFTEDTILTSFDIAAGYTSGFAINNVVIECQLEKGSNATPYVPYGYLPMYKGRYKVSDYCQFIKPNLFYNPTAAGLTITSNGDTFTVNGTSTKKSSIGAEIKNWTPIIGHKILVSGCPEGGGANTFGLGAFNQTGAIDYGNVAIGRVITTGNWFGIVFESGVTFNNLIFKPQLFDLTEMYGNGNEPTTVEQFREKFPDELYPYSPYCWANMKQMRYITTTKNLFDNIVPANNCRVSFATSRAIATQIAADTDTLGLFKIVSYNGSSYEVLSWIRDVLTLGRITSTFTTPETTGYKHIVFGLNGAKIDTTCLCEINLKPSTTYTFSCNFTNITQGSISWTDMQLEEGATATPYVPYGYLPLK